MGSPRVSVVVPTHYRNDRLADAIESVLASDHDPVEVVVVDDSGEAHAEPVCESYPVDYVAFEENRGGNPARTAGIERATGEYVQLLDDDDRIDPTKLSKQVARFEAAADDTALSQPTGDAEEHDRLGVVYSGMTFEGGATVLPRPERRGDVLSAALAFDLSPCVTSTMLVDADVLAEVLPLADRPGGDDLGLMIELARRARFDAVNESLVYRGEAEASRGKSRGVVEGRRQILTEYASLYLADAAARKQAVASTNALDGRIRLSERRWDASAVERFASAFRTRPSVESGTLLCGALLGAPGLGVADRVLGRLG